MVNILSVDLESWVHANPALYSHLTSEERKEKDQSYIIKSTKYLLDLFNQFNTRSTFFVVSEIFDWYPELIEQIREEGHEVAFHSRSHKIINNVNDFKSEIVKSKEFINTFMPKGFRAPFLNVKKEILYTLSEFGFEYDSSIYYHHPIAGFADDINEIPISFFNFRNARLSTINMPRHLTFTLLLQGFPYGSGYFMKLDRLIALLMRKSTYNHLFVHPWQILRPKAYFMSKKYLIKNPHWFLYSFDITRSLSRILTKYRFSSIEHSIASEIIFK